MSKTLMFLFAWYTATGSFSATANQQSIVAATEVDLGSVTFTIAYATGAWTNVELSTNAGVVKVVTPGGELYTVPDTSGLTLMASKTWTISATPAAGHTLPEFAGDYDLKLVGEDGLRIADADPDNASATQAKYVGNSTEIEITVTIDSSGDLSGNTGTVYYSMSPSVEDGAEDAGTTGHLSLVKA